MGLVDHLRHSFYGSLRGDKGLYKELLHLTQNKDKKLKNNMQKEGDYLILSSAKCIFLLKTGDQIVAVANIKIIILQWISMLKYYLVKSDTILLNLD